MLEDRSSTGFCGTGRLLRCSILNRGVQNYTPEDTTMGRNGVSQERAARSKEFLASIGRALRGAYLAAEPLPDRLSELVTKIERSAGDSKAPNSQTVARS
jgi:hypothetical protein